MKLSDFDFELPEALIATRPAKPRSSAKLLVAGPETIEDLQVTDLVDLLNPGDRLVLNDTKVIPARLLGVRRRDGEAGLTEAAIEVTLLEPKSDGTWSALVKPLKKVKDGEVITFSDAFSATMVGREDGQARLKFSCEGEAFDAALADVGAMPLPPYIAAKRPADEQDKTDYQTAWAKHSGAVAAPTASLHFDRPLLEALKAKGVTFTYVTLHVGAGTFQPVKVDDIKDHKMHAELGHVSQTAADAVNATKAAGGRVIPVGTTALRLVESAAKDGELHAWDGPTDIFITPGFEFQITDALMTNFHLPKSTLMMLVSALLGPERIKEVYAQAISNEYRFFSYGDASLLMPKGR
ncbi:tRNA preQ1(34) S-adenosylmethionine ribosyltransferase-isomerase QueA [Cognatiyoonia sp.]|uniref:tRNA preQ1(34) S-adenosylmethionine ribosyltransferase-isomerase QueA n=1 Tax=Cognatiyoonia sp. TaxID=2211652 RepID=UPI003F699943